MSKSSRTSSDAKWSWLLLAAGLALGAPAWAQDPAPAADDEAKAEEPAAEIEEEMTVTSRKIEESIQDVPFSVVAPSEEQLRSRGVDSIEGVAQNVPGLIVQNLGPGQSQVAMRGVSSGQIVRDQPGVKEQVGVYLDESAISLSLFTPDIDLFDVSRVEVLKGPQGTLFGSGSLSGTVRYITNQPELGVSSAVGEVGVSSIDGGDIGAGAKVALNTPIGDKAAMRIAAYYNDIAGWIDAVQPDLSLNDDVNGGSRAGVRLAFRFEPNERLSVTPRVLYQEVDMDGWNRNDLFNILANPFTTTRPKVSLEEDQQFTQFEEPFTDEFLLVDLNLRYDFGDIALTSITSYTDRDVLVVRDATALTASITGAGPLWQREAVYALDAPLDDATQVKALTQELRVDGARDAWAWVFGAFYSDINRDYAQSLLVSGFQDLSGIPTVGLRAAKDELFYSDLAYDLTQWAVFGEATWSVNDRFDLTGGLRWYNFDEDREQIFDGLFGNDNNGSSLVSQPGETDADGIVPRLIASYKLSEATHLNAQVSQGFRLGGINDPLNVPLCTPQDLDTFGGRDTWEDEKAWNYEVGTKSSVMDGRGTFNVSAFYMDIEDLQATVTAGSCSSRVVFNVPKAHSAGLELEYAGTPTEHFDFSISASYADSEVDSTLTSTDAAGNVTVVAGIEDGNRLPTVPEFQGVAAGTYQWHMENSWLGYVTGVYQYVGSRFTQVGDQAAGFETVRMRQRINPQTGKLEGVGVPFTQPTFNFEAELPSYDVLNLRLGFANEKWDLAAYVNNILDEQARLALDMERNNGQARVGYLVNQPRTFGVTARVNFR